MIVESREDDNLLYLGPPSGGLVVQITRQEFGHANQATTPDKCRLCNPPRQTGEVRVMSRAQYEEYQRQQGGRR